MNARDAEGEATQKNFLPCSRFQAGTRRGARLPARTREMSLTFAFHQFTRYCKQNGAPVGGRQRSGGEESKRPFPALIFPSEITTLSYCLPRRFEVCRPGRRPFLCPKAFCRGTLVGRLLVATHDRRARRRNVITVDDFSRKWKSAGAPMRFAKHVALHHSSATLNFSRAFPRSCAAELTGRRGPSP